MKFSVRHYDALCHQEWWKNAAILLMLRHGYTSVTFTDEDEKRWNEFFMERSGGVAGRIRCRDDGDTTTILLTED